MRWGRLGQTRVCGHLKYMASRLWQNGPAPVGSTVHWVGNRKVAMLVPHAQCQGVGVSGDYEKMGAQRRAPDLVSGVQGDFLEEVITKMRLMDK